MKKNNTILSRQAMLSILEDQKDTLEELKKSQEHYKTLFNLSPAGIIILDSLGYIYDVNDEFIKLIGYKKGELIRKHISLITTGEGKKNIKSNIKKVLAGEILEQEVTNRKKDGNKIIFGLREKAIILPDGRRGLLTICRDITKEKQAESALKNSEERYRRFISQINEGVYRYEIIPPMPLKLSVEKQIDYLYDNAILAECNKALLKMYGLKKENDFVGKSLLDFHGGRNNKINRETLRKFIKSGYVAERDITEERDLKGRTKYIDNNAMGVISNNRLERVWGTQTDITLQKKSELALKESEEKFRNLSEYSNSSIFIITDDKFVYANKTALKTVGYSLGEVKKLNFWDVVHPDFRAQLKQNAAARQIGKKVPSRYEFKIISQKGREIWVDFSASVILFEGNPSILCTSIDITDKKLAELALKESEEKFRTLTEYANSGIFILQGEKFVYVNKAFTKITGYELKDLRKHISWDFVHPDYREIVKKRALSRQAGKIEINNYEFKLITKKGNVIWIDFSATIINFLGKPAVLGTGHDITEKKQVEISLKESEEKFRSLAESTNSGIFIVRGEHFVYMNPALEKLSGYSQEEGIKMKFWDFVHPDHRQMIKQRGFARQRGKKVIPRYEFKIITKHGKEKWVDFFATKIMFMGSPSILGTTFDITEKKFTENKLRESELRYRTLFESANVGIGISSFEGKVISTNKAMHEMFGFNDIEWKRMNLKNNYYDKNERNRILKIVKKHGRADNIITRLITKKGIYKWVNMSLITIVLNNKKYILTFFSDISELKQTENKLHESLTRLEKSEQIASMGFLDWNLKTNEIYWSNEICRIFGTNPGDNWQTIESTVKLVHPLDREYMQKNLKLAIAGRKKYSIDHRMITKNNKTIWVHAQAELIKDNKGKPVYLLGTVLDITKRKLAEDKLLEQFQKNEKILSTTMDGFILADTKGIIVDVNNPYCKMMNYKRGEIIGKNIANIDANLIKSELVEKVKRFTKKGHDRFETVHIDKYGKNVDLDVNISLMAFEGETYVAAFVRDIRERKKYENEILEKQKQLRKLASHLQTVREEERKLLARELHDELGQILTAAKIDLNLLEKSSSENKKEIKEISNLINEGLVTTKRIVSQLRPQLLQELGLLEALKEMLTKFKQNTKLKTYLRTNNKDINLDIEQSLPLYRIVQESLTNIAKHSKSDTARVNIKSNNKELFITIKDNGVGFDPGKTNTGGYGLLGMKERLIPLNGDIQIKSKIGIGTTVTVKVPMDN